MRRLFYSSGSFLTGDLVGDAVLQYARALAGTGDADIVSVPARTDDGLNGLAHILVGPASQIFTMPAPSNGDEPFDREIVDALNAKSHALQPSRPEAEAPRTDAVDLDLA
ncbi:hypothetical protein D9V29_04275 [Mycetocola manganoxydans]|uniref:Uncharacterized protein n=1 Tax=Mycetocola manganoxydans TaxID=699879 RepID=A0A3L6ZWU7_9MICO|nr:hypothetical protein [Mycetocola manganoxydans]RLP72377.1 hypothetical protein D9V29_04275 [Mycetocola manganoxydans]GHD40669.1 hypothetical protein GCM10008097_05040 [Mycetocola manganoxydans]